MVAAGKWLKLMRDFGFVQWVQVASGVALGRLDSLQGWKILPLGLSIARGYL